MKHSYTLLSPDARRSAMVMIDSAPDGYVCEIKEATRTTDQNRLLWPLLHEISQQVNWYGSNLTADEWKDVLTASLKKQKAVPGIDGGFVVCGQSTSKMGKREFSDLIDLILAFGSQQGVKFPETRFMEAA